MDATTPTTDPVEKPTGLEDVVRSVRAIARSARSLAETSSEVAERELAMAINISDQLRDDIFSTETLEEARKQSLPAKLRQDAHDTVNLLADVGAVLFLTMTRFVEDFIDQPRPPLATQPTSTIRATVNRSVKGSD